jgi:hypothetical protein
MNEVCRECGKSWGVTMQPREHVLCQGCAQPKPWRRPVHYWGSRIWNYRSTKPYATTRSPEWWDQQTDRLDLEYALSISSHLGGGES